MNTPVTPKFGDQELASVLPAVTWWRSPHLRKVNLFMVILSLFCKSHTFLYNLALMAFLTEQP